ncbi:MAG: uracil-DNA glycosylase family protein, partial [Planctomycetota bacterium]
MAAANVGAAESLFRQAARCKRCPRMAKRSAVLGTTCGPLSAEVLFVGEAPGRLGADRSRVPFRGDRSGDNFDRLLRHVGLSRGEVFVTNAVLCCPVAD